MKKRKLILIGLLIWHFNSVFGQSCGTPHPINPTIYPQEDTNIQARGSSSSLCINVFYHIVRNTNGTNSFSTPNTNLITEELNKYFSPRNIIINNIGSDFINNSNFLTIDTDSGEDNSLFLTQNRSDAVNFYIVDGFVRVNLVGKAQNIPSTNLVMRNNAVLTSVSSHEFGHCLDLYHTFQGTASNTSGCAENINGSNCNTCGDLICDTPADANTRNTGGYNPDLTNIMSYYLPTDHFTNGQSYRMRYAIQNEPILQNISSSSCATISEINNVCYPQTKIISLNNTNGAITNWTTSSNIHIASQNNSSITVRGLNSNSTGDGWVQATLNNGIQFTETFEVGIPRTEKIDIHKAGSFKLYNSSWNWIHARYNGSYDYNIPNWEWRFYASQGVTIMTRSAYKSTIHVRPTTDGTVDIQARVSNECGCSGWRSKVFQIGNGGGSTGSGPGLEW